LRRTLSALFVAAGILPAATLVSSSRQGNSLYLKLSDGTAQVEWLSDSTFRFSRSWDGSLGQRPAANPRALNLKISDTPESLTIATKYLLMTIAKNGVKVRVAEPDGAPIMADVSEVDLQSGGLAWERVSAREARFYGLGAREDAAVELRGRRVAAAKPFLISSAGYGEFHVAPGNYSFDLESSKTDRYRIEAHGATKIDYYFFFGPAPKEILEQYLLLSGPMQSLSPSKFNLLRPSDVPAAAEILKGHSLVNMIHRLINGSMSGVLLPAISLDAFESDARAIQLGSIAPIVIGSRPDQMRATMRGELDAYFATYAEEARERGLPLIRALPMQFPKDAEAAKVGDEFMLGDELLVAPIYAAQNSRSVYLPMGIWTRLRNNEVFQGKRTVALNAEPDELPLFSRNGAILPLGSNPMTLHYFPRLGGEFFLFESDLEEYSQVHAGPAGKLMRLEIESKKDRDYEWIVHHLNRAHRVAEGPAEYVEVTDRAELRPGAWLYDGRNGNLHVRVRARAGGDEIVSISF
jgi:alpha-glucosidase (family GH31 glycosyl hydrolase)